MRKTQVMLAFAFSGFLLFAGQEVARAQEGASDAALRIWKTQSGGYATKATLRKFENGVVELQKENGSIVSLAIEKLSEADQEYVKKRTGGGKTAEDAPTTKPSEVGEKSELEIKCQYLCTEMTKGYKGKDAGGKATIAVVEFSDLSGGVTDFGRLLSGIDHEAVCHREVQGHRTAPVEQSDRRAQAPGAGVDRPEVSQGTG